MSAMFVQTRPDSLIPSDFSCKENGDFEWLTLCI